MLNKYIKDLLEKHNRVIVPDLGAFLHKGESPQVIYFNEFLRFNDGLLVDYYAEKENIDKIEAAKNIKSLVDNINKELQTKKIYQLEGVGTLIFDANEKIQLKSDIVKGFKSEDESPAPPAKPEPEKKSDTVIKEAAKTSVPEKEIEFDIKAENEKSTTKGTKKTAKQAPLKQEVVESPKLKETEVSTPVPPPIPKQVSEVKQTQIKPQVQSSYIDESTVVYEKQGGKKVVWIILVIFILGSLTAAYFLYFKHYFADNSVNQNKINVKASDTVEISPKTNADSSKNAVVTKPSAPIVKSIPAATGRKFYIIAGCFAQENNAEKLVRELQSKGFNAEKFAKISELYYVSIGSYSTREDAKNELNQLKNQVKLNLWIKKY